MLQRYITSAPDNEWTNRPAEVYNWQKTTKYIQQSSAKTKTKREAKNTQFIAISVHSAEHNV